MMYHKGKLILSVLLLCLFSANAIAACAFAPTADYPANSIKKMTVPLAISSISVPPGTAVGATVYRQRITIRSGADKLRIGCDKDGLFVYKREYKTLPMGETSTGSKIYKTGINGLGIVFLNAADKAKFPNITPTTGCTDARNCYMSSATGLWGADSFFQLVKTADSVTGGTISASNLPTALYSLGQEGSMVGIYEINISGSLKVTTPTCNITTGSQSMTVKMGSYHTSDFSGPGTGTAWKNASIHLNNCGWFYGNTTTSVATFNGTENVPVKALTSNAADITLTPLDGKLNAAEGIMSIASGTSAATGIGIQLSRSEADSGKINLDSAYSYSLPNDGSSTITVPLYARYIQTENTITGGNAIGKLEYTISYH